MSNEATIYSMNEVIAEFMGLEKEEEMHYTARYRKIYLVNGYWLPIKKLKYHTSWDWLMPVGKKIRDLLYDMQKQRPPHTACHGDLIEVDIHCTVSSYDIINAHKNMYLFIKWYNEYQQKQTNATDKK